MCIGLDWRSNWGHVEDSVKLHLTIALLASNAFFFLQFRLVRASQTFVFPIRLSEELVPAAIFYATVTPVLAWFLIKKTIVEPMNAEHRQRKIDKIKEQNKQRIIEKRKEAEAALDLMSAQYERICEEEERRKGLIIVSAKYGKFDDDSHSSPTTPNNSQSTSSFSQYEDIIIDVTIPLQCLIRDSKLKLHKASKVHIF